MLIFGPSLRRLAATVALGVMCASVAAACSSTRAATIELPGIDASPSQVLDTYLAAFQANDCPQVASLTTPAFVNNGDLCGHVTIDSFERGPDHAVVGNETSYAVSLQIASGTLDGTPPRNPVLWFFILQRQPDGSWKLTSGGSGP